jgi:hypothetical protein
VIRAARLAAPGFQLMRGCLGARCPETMATECVPLEVEDLVHEARDIPSVAALSGLVGS